MLSLPESVGEGNMFLGCPSRTLYVRPSVISFFRSFGQILLPRLSHERLEQFR